MEWKDSKLFIAISTSAATTIFLVTIYSTVVIPVYTEKYKYKLELISDEVAIFDKQKEQLVKSKAKVEELTSEITNLEVQLKHLQGKNPFRGKSVLPAGLAQVKFGMDISELKNEFPIIKIKKKNDWLDIDLDSDLFSTMTIYTDLDENGVTVSGSMITFNFLNIGKDTAKMVFSLMQKEFGELDYTESTRNDFYQINIENLNGYNIEINSLYLKIEA